MTVKLGPNGELNLAELFTKNMVKKIVSYSMDISTSLNTIRIWFYDSRGIEICPKLKKRRGKAKKA